MDPPHGGTGTECADSGLTGRGLLDRGLGGGDVLTGSAFALTRETRGGLLSFWSRGARSHFAGREGALSLGGAGTTVELAVEAERRERPLHGGTDHGALARATVGW